MFTKTQSDTSLALKANSADVYTKGQSDAALFFKVNSRDVYTKALTDLLLAAKANANNAEITGYIQTNKLKLSGLTDAYGGSGNIVHPTIIQFGISTNNTPTFGETVWSASNDSISLLRDVYISNSNLFVDKTSTFSGTVNFQGAVTGLPIPTIASLNLGNVNNTSDLNKPISTATQTALNF
jgi:hypothetical protein